MVHGNIKEKHVKHAVKHETAGGFHRDQPEP